MPSSLFSSLSHSPHLTMKTEGDEQQKEPANSQQAYALRSNTTIWSGSSFLSLPHTFCCIMHHSYRIKCFKLNQRCATDKSKKSTTFKLHLIINKGKQECPWSMNYVFVKCYIKSSKELFFSGSLDAFSCFILLCHLLFSQKPEISNFVTNIHQNVKPSSSPSLKSWTSLSAVFTE